MDQQQLDLTRRIDRLAREARWRVDVITSPKQFLDWAPEDLARATGYVVLVDAAGNVSSVPAASPAVIRDAQAAWAERNPELAARRAHRADNAEF